MNNDVNEALDKAEETAEKAAEAASEAAEAAGEAAETAEKAEETVQKAEKTAEKADETAEKADEVAEKADEASEKADEAAEKAEETVEQAEEAPGAAEETAAPSGQIEETAETGPEAVTSAESEDAVPVSAAPEEKPKKKSKAGKVILIIFIVLLALALLLAGAAFLTVRAATRDKLPQAPAVSTSDMNEFAVNAAREVLSENTITIDSSQFNAVLEQAKNTVNQSSDGVRVDDLFCELKDGKGAIYARVYVEEMAMNNGGKVRIDKTFPVELDFDVGFTAPEIEFIPEKLTCGTIDVPMSTVSSVLDGTQFPENMRSENGVIYYDTSSLDAKIDQILVEQIAEKMKENELLGALSNILGEDMISDIVTETTDVQIHDADIVDDKLIISAQIM